MNPADYSGADYIKYVCPTCMDFRVVAAPEGTPGSVPCSRCDTDEKRRDLFIQSKYMPSVRISDLDAEEQELFRSWRIRGHHELDCLRWIEGRRYEPLDDEEFLRDAKERLSAWRKARDEQSQLFAPAAASEPPRLHPCVTCDTPCDEQTMFCPACWKRWRDKHPKRAS